MPRRALRRGARRARRRVLHPRRVEHGPPALLVGPRELEMVALVRHADDDVSDPGPGVEPGPKRVERGRMRAWSTRRSRTPPAGVGRVGRAHVDATVIGSRGSNTKIGVDCSPCRSVQLDQPLDLEQIASGRFAQPRSPAQRRLRGAREIESCYFFGGGSFWSVRRVSTQFRILAFARERDFARLSLAGLTRRRRRTCRGGTIQRAPSCNASLTLSASFPQPLRRSSALGLCELWQGAPLTQYSVSSPTVLFPEDLLRFPKHLADRCALR
jgi:hypothetical protein